MKDSYQFNDANTFSKLLFPSVFSITAVIDYSEKTGVKFKPLIVRFLNSL